MFNTLQLFISVVLGFIAGTCKAQTTVSVSATASHAIPTSLWGIMYEDISHSGDSDLYAELLHNRSFQQVTPGTTDALDAWQAINDGASLTIVADTQPVSSVLPNALNVVISDDNTGPVGFGNTGYLGINVTPGIHRLVLLPFPGRKFFSRRLQRRTSDDIRPDSR